VPAVLLATAILASCVPVSAQGLPLRPGPRLQVETPQVDAGQVDKGDVIEATFVLRNTGDAPLHILKARPG
jgi:hypothetical protein